MRNAGRIVGNSTDQTASILICNGLASFFRKSHALRDVAKGDAGKKGIPSDICQSLPIPLPLSNNRLPSPSVDGITTRFSDKREG